MYYVQINQEESLLNECVMKKLKNQIWITIINADFYPQWTWCPVQQEFTHEDAHYGIWEMVTRKTCWHFILVISWVTKNVFKFETSETATVTIGCGGWFLKQKIFLSLTREYHSLSSWFGPCPEEGWNKGARGIFCDQVSDYFPCLMWTRRRLLIIVFNFLRDSATTHNETK